MALFIVGSSNDIQKTARFLTLYDSLCGGDSSCLQLPYHPEPEVIEWKIDNKYYTANVAITPSIVLDGLFPSIPADYEGVIVLTPPKDKFSEKDVCRLEGDDDKLRIIVQFTDQEDKESNKDRDYYQFFAIDHGFEFIEIDESNPTSDFDAREKFGLPRLIEALQSHMWSTASRKNRAGEVPMPPNPVQPAGSTVTPPVPTIDATAPHEGEDKALEEEFEDLEDFARAMLEARAFRDRVDQGDLTDAERREQAAAWAMRLGQMLNLGEEDDEEEES